MILNSFCQSDSKIIIMLIILILGVYVIKKGLLVDADINVTNLITSISSDKSLNLDKYRSSIYDILPHVIKNYDIILEDIESIVTKYKNIKSTDLDSINSAKLELISKLKSIEYKLDNFWLLKIVYLV